MCDVLRPDELFTANPPTGPNPLLFMSPSLNISGLVLYTTLAIALSSVLKLKTMEFDAMVRLRLNIEGARKLFVCEPPPVPPVAISEFIFAIVTGPTRPNPVVLGVPELTIP